MNPDPGDTIRLDRLSRHLGATVLSAEPVGRSLIHAVIWVDSSMVHTLVLDPESRLGWTFLSNAAATWRAAGLPEPS